MPHLKYTDESKLDLVRFSDFFLETAPHKATEAITKILETIDILKSSIDILKSSPVIGRYYQTRKGDFRELTIPYGQSGYVALYSFDEQKDLVTVHVIRHQKELGYRTI